MFQGFTKETSEFLWELSFNNERPWFLAHKEQFERCLNEPFKALAQTCKETMEQHFPGQSWRVHCSRIYRDARRLFGRGPYKDHLWFVIGPDEGHFSDGPMFWFEIGAAAYSYGLGFFDAAPAAMETFRNMVDANPARFERLAEEASHMRGLHVMGPEYKRPKGSYPPPVGDWYNRRYLACEWEHDFGGDLLTDKLPDKLCRAYIRLMPLYEFFLEVYHASLDGSGDESRR